MKILLNKTLAAAALCLAAGCADEQNGLTILDAAEIYRANAQTFAAAQKTYQYRFDEFTRIPARDPTKANHDDDAFLRSLRALFPVEFVDFFPADPTGRDEIDFILTRYGVDARYTVVSIVYSGRPLPPPSEGQNIGIFETCDERAVEWLNGSHGEGPVAAFCEVASNWYAYQRMD